MEISKEELSKDLRMLALIWALAFVIVFVVMEGILFSIGYYFTIIKETSTATINGYSLNEKLISGFLVMLYLTGAVSFISFLGSAYRKERRAVFFPAIFIMLVVFVPETLMLFDDSPSKGGFWLVMAITAGFLSSLPQYVIWACDGYRETRNEYIEKNMSNAESSAAN